MMGRIILNCLMGGKPILDKLASFGVIDAAIFDYRFCWPHEIPPSDRMNRFGKRCTSQVCHNDLQEEQDEDQEKELCHHGNGIEEEGDDVAISTNDERTSVRISAT